MNNSIVVEHPWQHYLGCLSLHLFLPVLPLVLEFIIAHKISDASITLAVAIYAISTGLASQNLAIFSMSLIISLIYTFLYGANAYALKNGTELIGSLYADYTLYGIFIGHSIERFKRHIIDKAPFWDILNKEGGMQ